MYGRPGNVPALAACKPAEREILRFRVVCDMTEVHPDKLRVWNVRGLPFELLPRHGLVLGCLVDIWRLLLAPTAPVSVETARAASSERGATASALHRIKRSGDAANAGVSGFATLRATYVVPSRNRQLGPSVQIRCIRSAG
jgi:hypothetical protein